MGNLVTVDSDDLECLLLASAAAKMIESQITSFRQDPAYRRRAQDIESAFVRINRARGDAIRVDEPFEPADLCRYDIEFLAKLFHVPYSEVTNHSDLQTLRRHRLVVVGIVNEYIEWGDKTREAVAQPKQVVRITEKGRKAILQLRPDLDDAPFRPQVPHLTAQV
ncbi:MAG TPA: hypothetical protein PKZ97_10705 [Azospirillaceae bacterium]|nr:hypothetical protein [Azospirillaceae bacterium]